MKSDVADYKIQFWNELELHPRLLLSVTPPILSFHNFAIRNYVSVFVNWKCS